MKDSTTTQNLPTIDVEPLSDVSRQADTRRLVRIAAWVIGAGFCGFLIWAAFAPLDEGVPTSGTIAVSTKRKAVQHLQGGIVREVLVSEGQMVEANQVVLRLNDSYARATYEAVRQRYFALRAAEGRLTAEIAGLPTIAFDPALVAAANDDVSIRQHMTVQTQLLRSRRESLAASTSALEESIRGQQGLIEGYKSVLATRKSQGVLLERELKGLRDLVAEGYAPLNKQMELERALADNAAAITDLQTSIVRAQSAILEVRQRIESLRSDYRKEVDTQLADVRRDVQSEAERFKAATEDLERTEIRAPATGQVVGLNVQTVGGVIQPGQKLMDIVPKDEALVLEAQVPPHLIDRIHPGSPVDVRFQAFAHTPQLVVAGKVDSISSDILTDQSSRAPYPYYLARISITEAGLKTLGKHQLQAGMPVEIVIKTGERSLLTYLLHPLLRRMSASMKEQ